MPTEEQMVKMLVAMALAIALMAFGGWPAGPQECRTLPSQGECVTCCVQGGQKEQACLAICKHLPSQPPSESRPR